MGTTLSRSVPSHVHAKSDGQQFAGAQTLVTETCPSCGILYAFPEALQRSALRWHGDRPNGWQLCCPLGHTWSYTGETEQDRLQRLLESERAHAGRLASERDQLAASERAQRGAATRARRERDRLKTRAAAGLCPCCNRTVKQLAAHMQTKHPDYLEESSS